VSQTKPLHDSNRPGSGKVPTYINIPLDITSQELLSHCCCVNGKIYLFVVFVFLWYLMFVKQICSHICHHHSFITSLLTLVLSTLRQWSVQQERTVHPSHVSSCLMELIFTVRTYKVNEQLISVLIPTWWRPWPSVSAISNQYKHTPRWAFHRAQLSIVNDESLEWLMFGNLWRKLMEESLANYSQSI